jgi:tetratricopeptide (TPR) repeat protein
VVARVGIHLAEVMAHGPSPPGTVEIEMEIDPETRQVPARLAAAAVAGQTLLTQGAFELARRTLAGVRVAGRGLRWESLGERAVEEGDEPAPIYAVVLEGSSLALEPSELRVPAGGRRSGGSAGRRWLTWAISAVLLAAVAVFGLLRFTGPSGGTGDGISQEARTAVAVLGFNNSSPSPEASAWLGTALSEMLGSELSAGETLRLIPGESVARMKLELDLEGTGSLAEDTLAQVRQILGTDYVIVGSYTVVEGPDEDRRLRIDLKLQDARQEGAPVSVSVTGEESELFDLVAKAGAELRNKLGVEEPSLSQAQAVAAALPASREAAQHYSEGLELLRGFDAQAALAVLEKAVAADPDFALAHGALSEAWMALGYDRQAEASARRAYELADELPEVDQRLIEGRYYEASAQWRKAIETYQALWRVFPDSVDYGLRLAGAQITAGRGREALATLERLHRLPPPAGEDPRIDLMEGRAAYKLFDYQRDLAAAGRAEREGRDLGARILVAEALQLRGQALMQLARIEEAEEALSEAERLFTEAGDRGKVAEVLDTRGVLRLLEGDLAEAEDLKRQALEIHRRTGNRKAVSAVLNHLALLHHTRGELAEARRLLAEAVEIAREIADRNAEAQYLDTTTWVALHQGELEEARGLADRELDLYRQIGSREGEGWGHFYLGQIALAAGDLEAARAEQEQALTIAEETGGSYQHGYALQALGEVLLAAGELDAAEERLAESEEVRVEIGERGPLAEARAALARLLLARGREGAAADLVRGVAEEFRSLGNRDYEADARALLARALLAVGDLDGAATAAGRARELGAASENPHVRLVTALATAEVDVARGRDGEARRRLGTAIVEAQRLGLVAAGLELRLARGELELEAGLPGARSHLEQLARDAEARGFGRIATEARERTR